MEICSMRGCNAVKSVLTEWELVSSSHGKKRKRKSVLSALLLSHLVLISFSVQLL